MARRPTDGPTEAELEILRVIWRRGPSTVREVHDTLRRDQPTGQTTTLKLMQIMVEKKLLRREESVRPQVYRPSVPEHEMQRRMVSDFLERAFGGSARKLMAALTDTDISDEELADIRRVLDRAEEDRQ